jgi:hypothetical protein
MRAAARGSAALAASRLAIHSKRKSGPTSSTALVRTTTSNLIAVRRLLLEHGDPEVCGPAPGATLPPAPQTSHDVDAPAATQRDRCRTGAATLAIRTSALRLCNRATRSRAGAGVDHADHIAAELERHQPPPGRGRDCWFVAPAATSSALLLQLVAGPEQKPERRPGPPMTRLVVRESGRLAAESQTAASEVRGSRSPDCARSRFAHGDRPTSLQLTSAFVAKQSPGYRRADAPCWAAAAARYRIRPLLLRWTAAPVARLLEVRCSASEQARLSLRVPPLLRLAERIAVRSASARRGPSTCGRPGRYSSPHRATRPVVLVQNRRRRQGRPTLPAVPG